jgi:hypothetical protein
MSIISKNSHYGPRTITNGLVLALDAGNSKSYPTTGTVWTDLSGNGNTGTLTNGPTYGSVNGGSLVFDGVDDNVQCSGSITLTSATFIVWMRRNGTQNFFNGILFSRGTSITGINFRSTTNQLGYHWNDTISTYNWVSGLLIPDLSWCMVVVSVTSSSATAYLYQASGLTTATNTVSHASTTLNNIRVGVDPTSPTSRYFNGNISQASLYNRALSATEIQQNYLATKSRYF